MGEFKVVSDYVPRGDQPKAIEELSKNILNGEKCQTLLGVTGSGKTFTVANIIEKVKKPTLVIAHNKTLAGQLYSEFKEFFPENSVEFFVSYYDYYQPEAYVAHTDTYIEKDASINDEIDKLRHSATAALLERRDVIIVASVSCIYGLGNPVDYKDKLVSLRPGMEISRDEILKKLIDIQYTRNDINFIRGTFRVRGDVIEIISVGEGQNAIRVEMFGDEIEKITEINSLTGEIIGIRKHISIFPATHYVVSKEDIDRSIETIESEMIETVKNFESQGKLIEAQRIKQRTLYDIEMLKEVGYCQGIENYSRILYGRPPGSRPFTLIDFFPDDFLIVVDESHVTLPQIRGMHGGDRSRKNNLVDYGFRLPSALDNRPLNFDEFESMVNQIIYVSATPSEYELNLSGAVIEQIIRPTGLVDPVVEVRPINGQIDDLYGEIIKRTAVNERILVTTLTKKMAEDLTTHFKEMGIRVKYLHSDIKTMERMKIIKELREGKFDVLVGINLLREGLDIPEVSLVAILDADKEGFLRSETSLIQTTGRAARNSHGKVIMYADRITNSMERANSETERRRIIQEKYNIENNITPTSITKDIRKTIEATLVAEIGEDYNLDEIFSSKEGLEEYILELEEEMKLASNNLQFERAAEIRDKIIELKEKLS